MTLRSSKKHKSSHRNRNRTRNNVNRTKKRHYSHLRGGADPTQLEAKVKTGLKELISFFPDTTLPMDKFAESIVEKMKAPEHHSSLTFNLHIKRLHSSGLGVPLRNIHPSQYSLQNLPQSLEYFEQLDSVEAGLQKSKVLYCLTHSGLPHPRSNYPYALVPPNMMVCFVNPIQNYGNFKENYLFTDIPAGQLENRKKLFQQLFNSAQKTDQQSMKYESFYMKGFINGISNLKLGSWYYPGQAVPNVVLTFKKEELMLHKKLGVSQISYPTQEEGATFGVEEDTYCKEQIETKGQYFTNLLNLLLRYQNPNFRYIIYVKGCRAMPYHNFKKGQSIDINFYDEMMKRELYYSVLNRNIPNFQKLSEEDKNLSQHIPLNYYSSVVGLIPYDTGSQNMGYTLENKIYLNFKNLHFFSRYTQVYLELSKNIESRLLTADEILFIQLNSKSKLILFLINIFKKTSGQIATNPILKKNIDKILRAHNLIQLAFTQVYNMYEYIYNLETQNNLRIEHPVVSQYLVDLFLSQSQNLKSLSEYVILSKPLKLITRLYLTPVTLQQLKTSSHATQFLHKITHLVFENHHQFQPDDFSNFPHLNNIRIKNLHILERNHTHKFPTILFLELNNFLLSSSDNLLSFLSQFPNLESLKIVFSINSNPVDVLDLSGLDHLNKLTTLYLENITNISIFRIRNEKLKILELIQQGSKDKPFTIFADFCNIQNIQLKVVNLNTEVSYIKGNPRLDSYKYESTMPGSKALAILKEDNYLCTSLQINCYKGILNDLKKFRCQNIGIDGYEGPKIDLKLCKGLFTCNTESLDLVNFALAPDFNFTQFGALIPVLFSISDKEIIIRDSNTNLLEKYLVGIRHLSSNILFFDCE